MDLHTGLSLWREQSAADRAYPRLEVDKRCDVAIVGGGVTGALLGYYFSREGIHAIILDADRPAEGSTAASSGLLQYEVDTHLVTLIKKVGLERAVHAYQRGVQAIDELEVLISQLDNSCGFSRKNSLYFASSSAHIRALEMEFECRRTYNLPVTMLSSQAIADLSSIHSPGGILSTGAAQFDPYQFTQTLLRTSAQAGVEIYGHTKVQSFDEQPREVILQTNGARVRAKAVVIATGYQTHEFFPTAPGDLQSTYVVASQPLETFSGWPTGCLLWETARPYFYGRLTDDGRALIGGADTECSDDHQRDGLVEKKAEELMRRFTELFPGISFQPYLAWAGTFAETKDGLAYLGKPAAFQRTYFALGYGGNGFTFSVIAARLIVDLFCGRPNPDSQVFSFER